MISGSQSGTKGPPGVLQADPHPMTNGVISLLLHSMIETLSEHDWIRDFTLCHNITMAKNNINPSMTIITNNYYIIKNVDSSWKFV